MFNDKRNFTKKHYKFTVKMSEKKINVGVSETPNKRLDKIVEHKNKEAGTKLYSKRTFLDTLINDTWNAIFGKSDAN
jgi:glycine cleavage system H lipoate-binding protein